ncbi:MAG: hypothetical protein KKC18_10050, partial [Chloroflexi bacterium]|nr:hypothetical protein [Chloroflexota bacterium]
AVLVVLMWDVPPLRLGGWEVAPAWPLLVVYLALLPLTLGRAWVRLARGEWVDPYDESPAGPPRDLLHLIHHPFPTVILPLYLAVWLTVYYWPNAVFIVGLALLYGLYDPNRWAGTWPVRTLRAWLRRSGEVR